MNRAIRRFAVGLAVGWSEELIFRGYLVQNIEQGISLTVAVVLSCLFYGVVHMFNPNAGWLSGLIIVGFGYIRVLGWLTTSQLWFGMGMHSAWNFFQGPIFGFNVSGTEAETLIHHTVTGPAWLTGGEFGPEGSVIIIPILALAVLAMHAWTRKRTNTPWQRWRGGQEARYTKGAQSHH